MVLCQILSLGPRLSHIEADTNKRMNGFESLIQLPDLSNIFDSHQQIHQQIYPQFSTQDIFNREAASDLLENNAAEEDIDNLLTDLFNEDGGVDDSPTKPTFELPKPGTIGLSAFPDSRNNNQASRNDFFTVESWQLCVKNEFDLQNYSFPDLDKLEDQDVLDARDLIVPKEISKQTQSSLHMEETSVETEKTAAQINTGGENDGDKINDGGVYDVIVGQDTSSLDQEVMTALEIPSNENNCLQKDKTIVSMVLPNKVSEMVVDSKRQSEVSLTNNDQNTSESSAEIIPSEPQTEDKKEDPEDLNMREDPKEAMMQEGSTSGRKDENLDCSDVPVVKSRRGRKRKPGTVVDLLVSNYSKKRSSRCKVGASLVCDKLTDLGFMF